MQEIKSIGKDVFQVPSMQVMTWSTGIPTFVLTSYILQFETLLILICLLLRYWDPELSA